MRIGRFWILWRPWANRARLFRMAGEMFPADHRWCLNIGPLQVWWFNWPGLSEPSGKMG